MTLVDWAFGLLLQSTRAVSGWFFQIFSVTGAGNLLVAVFACYSIVRLLFSPLFGSSLAVSYGDRFNSRRPSGLGLPPGKVGDN